MTRSAYAQLHYSPLRLVGAVLGMAVVYLAPPLLASSRAARARACAARLFADGSAYMPSLRFYGLSRLRALALPLVAACYTWFTVESALQHMRGRGGAWKGRYQAQHAKACGWSGAQAGDEIMAADIAFGQDPSGREFSRRLASDRAASIARRSSPSTISCARPTISPTMRRSRRTKSSRCSTGWRRRCCGAGPDEPVAARLREELASAADRRSTPAIS